MVKKATGLPGAGVYPHAGDAADPSAEAGVKAPSASHKSPESSGFQRFCLPTLSSKALRFATATMLSLCANLLKSDVHPQIALPLMAVAALLYSFGAIRNAYLSYQKAEGGQKGQALWASLGCSLLLGVAGAGLGFLGGELLTHVISTHRSLLAGLDISGAFVIALPLVVFPARAYLGRQKQPEGLAASGEAGKGVGGGALMETCPKDVFFSIEDWNDLKRRADALEITIAELKQLATGSK